MTRAELKKSRAICDAATPGPWEVGGPYPGVSVIVCVDYGQGGPDAEPPIYEPIAILDQRVTGEPNATAVADAAFIAYARTALPKALDEIDRLEDTIRKLKMPFHDRINDGLRGD